LGISILILWIDLNVHVVKGKILKTHGGDAIKKLINLKFFSKKPNSNIGYKKKIAERAAEFVSSGDVIGMNIGRIAMLFAAELKGIENITVVTTSFCAA
jgi:DeoR family transcriptional regulator, fructose operon transcriptional repressor